MHSDQISLEIQASTNLTWFAVDAAGQIGSFESSGFAWVHPAVLNSESNHRLLVSLFNGMPSSSDAIQELDNFARLNVEENPRENLDSASLFARRGLFVFDVPFSPPRETLFIRIVRPSRALLIDELPEQPRMILSAIQLPVRFADVVEFRPPKLT